MSSAAHAWHSAGPTVDHPGDSAALGQRTRRGPGNEELLGGRRLVDLVDAAARLAELIAGVGRRVGVRKPYNEHALHVAGPAVGLGVAAHDGLKPSRAAISRLVARSA